MTNLNELKPVGKLNPFGKFCCTIGNLPTSYMVSLTYEEQLLWLCNYLENTIIPAVNTNAEAVKEIQELFIKLKSYVDNYFNNLDVQIEINNKLDEMAEDGTLNQIINQEIFGSINRKIDIINSKNTILMGDSYGVGYTIVDNVVTYVNSWCYWFKQLYGLNDNNSYTFVEGGIGFADSGQGGHNNFLDLLQANINNIQDKDLIKNIVVCAGYNDKNANITLINNAISDFISYCKQQFPNAKVYIGMIGNDGNMTNNGASIRNILRETVLIAYQTCSNYGGIYLNGVENIMHYYPNFGEDNYHPSANGYKILGSKIFQAFLNGKSTYNLRNENAIIENENISSFGTMRISCQMCDNNINFKVTEGTLTFSNNINLNRGYINLGVVKFNCYRVTNIQNLSIPLFIGITTDDNKYYGSFGLLTVNNNNELVIGVRITQNNGNQFINIPNIKSLFFSTANATIPTINA